MSWGSRIADVDAAADAVEGKDQDEVGYCSPNSKVVEEQGVGDVVGIGAVMEATMWVTVGVPPNPSCLLQRHSYKLVSWAMCTRVHHLCPSCHRVHRPRRTLAVFATAAPIVVVLHPRGVAFAASFCTCYDPCLSREGGLHLVLDSVEELEVEFVVGVDCSLQVLLC